MAEEQNITQRSVRGGAWLFARKALASLIRMAAVAVLARHLSPSEFGLVALAQVVLLFITLTGDTGIRTYVIYDREPGWEDRINSAFWLNLVVAGAQLGLLLLAMPLVHRFYDQALLIPILTSLALVFVTKQLSVVPEGIVQRRLEYRSLAIRDTTCDLVSASLSVAMAIAGWGVWSLIWPQVVIEPVRLIAIFSIAKWRPRLSWGLKEWPRIGRYSGHLMGTSLLGLVLNDGDTLLVGKVLGSHSLGFYNMAWQLSNLISRNVTSGVVGIAMPSLAMLDKNLARVQSACRRMLRLLAAVSFPLLAGMFVLADDLILVVYGPRWAPAILLLRLFIIFTVVRSVTSPCAIIYNVLGRPDIGFKFNAGFLPFYLAAIYTGSKWGVTGVAAGVTIVRVVGGMIALALSANLIRMPFFHLIRPTFRAGFIALAMSGLLIALKLFMGDWGIDSLPRIVVCVCVGGVFYALALARFEHEAYAEIAKVIGSAAPSVGTKLMHLGRRPLLTPAKREL